MPTVLMVAEKPMLADSIAKLLSDGRATKRKGWNGACSVSEYTASFLNYSSARFKVTSTCGHVMSIDFPPKYNNWERVDPVELFSAPTTKVEATAKLRMNDYLASEAKGCDYLVLWLDCDKEGENICFEVIDAVQSSMVKPHSGNYMDNVYRAHFSAITEKDIKAAMRTLGRPNENESLSVDARQELDLRIGCSFTRFQTRFFQGKYGDLDSTLISFGPCQTPTLGFCVTRHDEIVQFKPEPYWVIQVRLKATEETELKPEWSRGRMFDREVCQMFLDRIKMHKEAVVVEVTKKESQKQRPLALNTVELMRVASSGLGIGPATAMQLAEQLYTRGYISYPRTETTSYSANFDLRGTLQQQAGSSKWGATVKEVLAEGITKPRQGDDKGDHPPITPMRADDGQLSGDLARIYEYIVQHFIGTVMKPCRYWVTTLHMTIGDEQFSASGKALIDEGFTKVMPWLGIGDDEQLPELRRGDRLAVKDLRIVERQTSPPDYLTEAELITLMEKHGIGTDASIPVHINNISQRNYVTVESGRKLVPTKLGVALVHGYLKVDPQLVLPTMRSEVETQLTLIAKGEADFLAVKNHALENFRLKFIYFVENITFVDALFEDSFTTLADAGKPFAKCGKCRRFMKLVQSRPQRLHCSSCQDTYALPNAKDGLLKLHMEKKCPLDDFDLLYWQGPGGKLSRSYAFCPYCYNNPPFPGMKKSQGCNECTHPACPHAFSTQGVVKCPQACSEGNGVLVLDPQSAPKWRLCCNKCAVVVGVFEGATRVRVSPKQCDDCGAQLMSAEYKEGKTPLPESKTSYLGCVFCDEELGDIINLNHVNRTIDQRNRQEAALSRG
uniref:DNA topoisomerase n=1 Tax=Plectus sambesii TaxID=2011161 RepID=A0A914WQU9_9BILA